MKITVKLPEDITKKMRKTIFTRNVLEQSLGTAINAGADITSVGLREYAERVAQANEDVQAAWDEVFQVAADHGYADNGISTLTLGPSYRTVRFDFPDPETDPVTDPVTETETETETELEAGEAGEAQNE